MFAAAACQLSCDNVAACGNMYGIRGDMCALKSNIAKCMWFRFLLFFVFVTLSWYMPYAAYLIQNRHIAVNCMLSRHTPTTKLVLRTCDVTLERKVVASAYDVYCSAHGRVAMGAHFDAVLKEPFSRTSIRNVLQTFSPVAMGGVDSRDAFFECIKPLLRTTEISSATS